MDVMLVGIHWVYLLFVGLIISFLVLRQDITIISIAGIFFLGLLATSSISLAVSGIFTSFMYAAKELFGIILIISIIAAMSHVLLVSGINETMVSPFAKLMCSPTFAYWTLGIVMFISSTFLWPSPAVALIGPVLLPAAIRIGLPPLAIAMAMNLFGHGAALSGDFIIQGAPKLTADAAGLPVQSVLKASVPLVLVMGIVTTSIAFWAIRRDIGLGRLTMDTGLATHDEQNSFNVTRIPLSPICKTILAFLIPLFFAINIVMMFKLNLQGGESTALVGGTAAIILIAVTVLTHRRRAWEQTTNYLVDGFLFGFKVFGPVIPIAAFFYLGDSAFLRIFSETLPAASNGIVNDLGLALAHNVALHPAIGVITLAIIGAITGLDGSGFSGISLPSSIAVLFGAALGGGTDTLTALGQVAAIWVGGGTLIPWSLISVASICGVSPFELARRNLVPVMIGLTVTTFVAMLLLLLA